MWSTRPGLTMEEIPYQIVLMAITLRQQLRLRRNFLNEKKKGVK